MVKIIGAATTRINLEMERETFQEQPIIWGMQKKRLGK